MQAFPRSCDGEQRSQSLVQDSRCPPQRCQAPQDAVQARTPPPGPGPATASASSRAPAETGISQMTTSASGGTASSPGKCVKRPPLKGWPTPFSDRPLLQETRRFSHRANGPVIGSERGAEDPGHCAQPRPEDPGLSGQDQPPRGSWGPLFREVRVTAAHAAAPGTLEHTHRQHARTHNPRTFMCAHTHRQHMRTHNPRAFTCAHTHRQHTHTQPTCVHVCTHTGSMRAHTTPMRSRVHTHRQHACTHNPRAFTCVHTHRQHTRTGSMHKFTCAHTHVCTHIWTWTQACPGSLLKHARVPSRVRVHACVRRTHTHALHTHSFLKPKTPGPALASTRPKALSALRLVSVES